MPDQVPTKADATRVVQTILGTDVNYIERFPTGLAHFVYDVHTTDGCNIVVRMTRPIQQWMFRGALYWHERLVPLGVPLPRLLHVDLAEEGSFPVILMERLPGDDLGIVYPSLSKEAKRTIANEVVRIQQAIASLPLGPGYGYAVSYEDTDLQPTWTDVLLDSLEGSRKAIIEVGIVDAQIVERVRERVALFAGQLAAVEPRCFLDDMTTKNVIIYDGAVSGIVDVDTVCFGDPLFTTALTRMSLLSSGWETDYIDAWIAAYGPNADQRKLLDLYTAIFCVGFLGEQGQQFNKDAPPVVDMGHVQRLIQILEGLLVPA